MLQGDNNTIDEGKDSKIHANENYHTNHLERSGEIESEAHDDNDDDDSKAVGSQKINLIVLGEVEYDDKEIINGDGVIRVNYSDDVCI
jgi:hypothetical protein